MTEDAPALKRGDMVSVSEPGLNPWAGIVLSVKLSRVSGWRVEVRKEDGLVWNVPSALVAKVAQ